MYENFTDRARVVMQLANQEAQRFNHEYVGTEHILLGLTKEGSGVAAWVLEDLGVDLRKIRLKVEEILHPAADLITMGKLPLTPRANSVIGHALSEARKLQHSYIGTEHLLLGLLCEQEGVAAQVLMNLGLKLDAVRHGVLKLLRGERCADPGQAVAGQPTKATVGMCDSKCDQSHTPFPLTPKEITRVIVERAGASIAEQLNKNGIAGDLHIFVLPPGSKVVVKHKALSGAKEKQEGVG
jgi:ATP-dependent Clp protease ATP-binding subunit ClpC